MAESAYDRRMSDAGKRADAVAAYYDSDSADAFYHQVWGGEDIHIGLHADDDDRDIVAAGVKIVERMASALGDALNAETQLIDLGAGYGGSARRLVGMTGCSATCLNLSAVQNARNRKLNAQAGLEDRIDVIEGDFAAVPAPDGAFDVVWSQDAFLHAADQTAVLAEAYRLARPGGRLIFTDPMQRADGADPALSAVYARLDLDRLMSPEGYIAAGRALGFVDGAFDDLSPHLGRHYAAVRAAFGDRREAGAVDAGFADKMIVGLDAWVAASRSGRLAWGVVTMSKPA